MSDSSVKDLIIYFIIIFLPAILYILFTIYFYYTNTSRFWGHIIYIFITILLILIALFLEYKENKEKSYMSNVRLIATIGASAMVGIVAFFYVIDDIIYIIFRSKSDRNKQNNIRQNKNLNTTKYLN